ncbi:MAG: FG-GAP repeat domain-containing protein [Planctomycetota bacterium]|jgi:hypothetical protein
MLSRKSPSGRCFFLVCFFVPLIAGCGLGGISLLGAANKAAEANDDNPVYVDAVPVVILFTPDRQVGDITISYRLFDIESDNCTVFMTYGFGAGELLNCATPSASSPPTDAVTSSAIGIDHTFVWNSQADLGNGLTTDVRIGIVAYDGIGNSVMSTTELFTVGNDPPVAGATTPSGEQAADIALVYTVSDTSSDYVDVDVQFRLDNASAWLSAKPIGGIAMNNLITVPNPGQPHIFVWESLDNIGGVGSGVSDACQLRVRARDGFDTGNWSETAPFPIRNNFTPGIALVSVGTPTVSSYRGLVEFEYVLYDTESDILDVIFQWFDELENCWSTMTEYPLGYDDVELSDGKFGLSSLPAPSGTSHKFLWDSYADIKRDMEKVGIRLYALDSHNTSTAAEFTFNYQINNNPYIAAIVPDSLWTSGSIAFGNYRMWCADLDNNGYDEVITVNPGSFMGGDGEIQYFHGGPQGYMNKTTLMTFPGGVSRDIYIGDFYLNDGIDDFAIYEVPGELTIYPGSDGAAPAMTDNVSLALVDYLTHPICGDFNNDGLVDVVIGGTDVVNIYPGRSGDVPDPNPVTLETPAETFEYLQVDDFNNDGISDLLVFNDTGSSSLYCWLGGSGAFPDNSGRITLNVGSIRDTYAWPARDVNGDQFKDILVQFWGDNSVGIFYGSPSGPINALDEGTMPGQTGYVEAFDLDGDGYMEIILAPNDGFPDSDVCAYIVPGTPAGPAWGNVTIKREEVNMYQISSMDSLGEGTPQLHIFDYYYETLNMVLPTPGRYPSFKGGTSIKTYMASYYGWEKNRRGNITGTGIDSFYINPPVFETFAISCLRDASGFGEENGVNLAAADGILEMCIIDTDNDAMKELFYIPFTGSRKDFGHTICHPGSGPERNPEFIFISNDMPRSVAAADFNADGLEDIAITYYEYKIDILLGTDGGVFPDEIITLDFPDYHCCNPVAGDFDNDGDTDLVTFGYDSGRVRFHPGPIGTGYTLDNIVDTTISAHSNVFRKGDFNGDGIDDIVCVTNGITILLGNDGVGISPAGVLNRSTGSSSDMLLVSDFNQDGIDDVAIPSYGLQNCVLHMGSFPDGPDTTIDATFTYPAEVNAAAAGDMNGDGYHDLLIPCYNGTAYIHFGNSTGLSASNSKSYNLPGQISECTTTDINGDGIYDAVMCYYNDNKVYYILGSMGNGPASDAYGTLNIPYDTKEVHAADLNFDMIGDLVIGRGGITYRIYLSNACGQAFRFNLTPDGGTFAHRNRNHLFCGGFRLTVPAGAVQNEVDCVMMHPLLRKPPSFQGAYCRSISKPVAILRETLVLSQNASLTIPISNAVNDADWTGVNNASIVVLRHERETDSWTSWDFNLLSIDEEDRTVTLSIERFGYYIVALKP